MKRHHLKIDPGFFDMVDLGIKPYEIRFNDRGYKVGDILVLEETRYSGREMNHYGKPLEYTERVTIVRVKQILTDHPGLQPGFIAMGIERIKQETR